MNRSLRVWQLKGWCLPCQAFVMFTTKFEAPALDANMFILIVYFNISFSGSQTLPFITHTDF